MLCATVGVVRSPWNDCKQSSELQVRGNMRQMCTDRLLLFIIVKPEVITESWQLRAKELARCGSKGLCFPKDDP